MIPVKPHGPLPPEFAWQRGELMIAGRAASAWVAAHGSPMFVYDRAIVAARMVDGIDDALAHIARHGSAHPDAIITADAEAAETFLAAVDSAIVLWNASTQFADGGEFGLGAEIGIATGRMHARGPVGAEQLTSFKYRVHGSGQIRP